MLIDFYGGSDTAKPAATPTVIPVPQNDGKRVKTFYRSSEVVSDDGTKSVIKTDFELIKSDGLVLFNVIEDGTPVDKYYAGREDSVDVRKSMLRYLFSSMPLSKHNGVFMMYRFKLADGRDCTISGSIYSEKFDQELRKKGIDKLIYRLEPFITAMAITDSYGDVIYRRKTFETIEIAMDFGQCLRAYAFAYPDRIQDYLSGDDEDVAGFIDQQWIENSGQDEITMSLEYKHVLEQPRALGIIFETVEGAA